MKFVAVLVLLFAFSGCHGRILPQDQDQPQDQGYWQAAVDGVRGYFSGLNSRADLLVQDLQKTQVYREIDTLTQDSMAELALYRDNLHSNLGPYTQERAEQLTRDLQALAGRLSGGVAGVGTRAAQYRQELQSMLELSADNAGTTFSSYARKIRKRLNKDQDLFNKNVATYVEELQSRTSDNMQKIQSRVEPFLTQVRDNAEAKISTINRLLQTQTSDAADKIRSSTEDMRERFDATAEKLRSTLEEKAKELRAWFSD